MAASTRPLTRAKAIPLIVAALLLGLIVAFRQELPQWRIGGTRSIAASSVAFVATPPACPANSAAVAIIGDSHVSGDRLAEGGLAFGAVTRQALAGRIAVARYGVGGETAAEGEARWRGRNLPGADLVILAFGTNDAAPRGWLRGKTPVPLADFKASLTRQIAGWRAQGSEVALIAPPPGGSAAISLRLGPYRQAVRAVGVTTGTRVFDPADAFASCPAAQPVLLYDALHMNGAGHRCLGTWLAHQICPPHH